MAAVASGYFLTVLKSFLLALSSDLLQSRRLRAVPGASSVTPFSAENNVPGVSSVV